MPRAEAITSARNPLLQEIRRAVSSGALTVAGLCVAESFHLLEEALRSGCEAPVVLATASTLPAVEERIARAPGIRLITVPDRIFRLISSTGSPQGVMALVRPRIWTIDQLFRANPLIVILDGVQDPGNAGAIVRAAEAFGASGAIFMNGAARPHNPKALRASAGSLFRLPFAEGLHAGAVRELCLQRGLDIYATVAHGGLPLEQASLAGACAVVVGSEAHGVSRTLRAAAREVRIPTCGVESLNASVAAAIILYEANRQRRTAASGGGAA